MRRIVFLVVLVIAVLTAPSVARASVRLAFTYPWYPESYEAGTHFHPDLMPPFPYDSGDPVVIDRQIAAMRYGHVQGAILSWWGPGHSTDRRFPTWLAESNRVAPGVTGFKDAIYYESEGNATATEGSPNPPASAITADLDYIAARYADDPAYLHLDGKPVIFAYGDPGDDLDGCSMVNRWVQANADASARFFIVLKVFNGYRSCTNQPDGWHQYAGAAREDTQGEFAKIISPGFWK